MKIFKKSHGTSFNMIVITRKFVLHGKPISEIGISVFRQYAEKLPSAENARRKTAAVLFYAADELCDHARPFFTFQRAVSQSEGDLRLGGVCRQPAVRNIFFSISQTERTRKFRRRQPVLLLFQNGENTLRHSTSVKSYQRIRNFKGCFI